MRLIRRNRREPLTTQEACEALRVTTRQLYNLRKSGRLELTTCSMAGRDNLYTPESVRAEQIRRRDEAPK